MCILGIPLSDEDAAESLTRLIKLSVIGPEKTIFVYGMSYDSLLYLDPFMGVEEALEIDRPAALLLAQRLWDDLSYGAIGDRDLAKEAFCLGCVFGHDTAAWLLQETCTMDDVDRTYVLRDPDQGITITRPMVAALAKRRHALKVFRMLYAGYVGWLRRTTNVAA